jgi:ribosomal protein S3AE
MAIAKKKKRFFDVEIPILRKETQLFAFTPEELNKRVIKYDLTRLLRGKNAILSLNVEIIDKKPTTTPKEFQILPTFLRKMVRKGTSYIEDSFSADCKDAKIKIKPFLIARRKVSRRIKSALRIKAKEEIIDYVKDKTYEDVFKEILRNQLQKPLSIKLKKIYPLSLCEIRFLKVEKQFIEKPSKKPETKKVKEVEIQKEEIIEEEKE